MHAGQYIAKKLADHGVKTAFVLTGNGAMYLNDGIVQENRINYFCARNEAAAPMMAEAYSRLTGNLSVVCVTSGPGATNTVPGLAEAFVDSAPVIILSGQVNVAHALNTREFGLRTYGNAEIDIISIVKRITKYAHMIDSPISVKYHIERAIYEATSGRPGPVWLDIPADIQSSEIDFDSYPGFTPEPCLPRTSAASFNTGIERTIEILSLANRPLVVCGNGIRQSHAIDEFKFFIESLNLPFICTRLGNDIISHAHPLNYGYAGIRASRYCKKMMHEADVVLVLGARLAVPFVGNDQTAFNPQAKIIMVDIDSAELYKNNRPKIEVPINADLKEFFVEITKAIKILNSFRWNSWLQDLSKVKSENPILNENMKKNPIDLYYFMSRLDALSNKDHVFVTDAGSNYYVGGQIYTFSKGQREITSSAFAAMGLSIPLAIGCSVAEPNKQILAVTGDGSLELNIQELKTMSYYKKNIKLFVINNGGYLSMKRWQDDYFDGRRIGSDEKSGIDTLNLPNVAKAFDLKYYLIDSYDRIDTQLIQIMQSVEPSFVEVVCDPNQKIIVSM